MSLEQLKSEVAECAAFLEQAKSARIKGVLTQAKAEAERAIVNLEIKARLAAESKAAGGKQRYFHELTDYGWDQGNKFVKLFITLNGVQNCSEDDVTVNYTPNSLQLHVRDLNGKDFGLTVNNLIHNIDVDKSYRKIKTDMVAIYLKKVMEGDWWDGLTAIQQRLKKKQDRDMAMSKLSPQAALLNRMKQVYENGDLETKQIIAKAWTESEEKIRLGQDVGGLGNYKS